MTPATQAALSRLSYAQHRRDPVPIATGTLIRQRSSGFFWYVVGVIGGKPGGRTAYMLGKHPKGRWYSLADAADVEIAQVPEVRPA